MSELEDITAGQADVRLDAVGLHLPENMALKEWWRVGERLRDTQQSIMWWIGDWLRFGERVHGVTYASAALLTGFKEGSLRDAVWLSGQFDLSVRTDKLTWHHHRHAASLPPVQRADALRRAADEGLSSRAFKALISDMKRSATVPQPPTDADAVAGESAFASGAGGGVGLTPSPTTEPEPDRSPTGAEPEPEPAPDPYADERKGLSQFTREGLEDFLIEARIALAEEKAKRKKAEAKERKASTQLRDLTTNDDQEVIRRLSAKIEHQHRAVRQANEKFEAKNKEAYALRKRNEELERERENQVFPL